MTEWEEEIRLIDNLGLLYPEIDCWEDYDKDWNNERKACWVYYLCVYHLDQRIPQLEKFIKYYCVNWWNHYKEHFKIK